MLKLLKFKWVWIIIGIPLLSYLVLKPTFNLSLYGDDWQALYYTWLEFDVRKAYNWFDIRSYFGPYNFSYFYLGVLNNLFGQNIYLYFYNSLFFRILCTISIYFLTEYLTKQKLSAFLASLFFILLTTGLETTDWVFNMNTYLGVFFFNFAIIYFFKIRSLDRIVLVHYLIFILLLIAGLTVVSTRMHGAIPFLIIVDIILTFFIEKKKFTFNFLLRTIVPVLVLLALISFGVFGKVESGGFTDRLKLGFNNASTLVQSGEKIFLLFFPGIIGHVVLPDSFYLASTSQFGLHLSTFIFTAISILIAILATLGRIGKPLKTNLWLISLVTFDVLWIGLTKLLYDLSPTKTPPAQTLAIIAGGQFLFFIPWLAAYLRRKNTNVAVSLIFAWFYMLAFTIIYWLFNPNVFIETTGRYLISAGIGFSILFGTLFSYLVKNTNFRIIGLACFLLVILLVTNTIATNKYLSLLETNRNAKLANSIWQSLTDSINDLDINNPTIFFFTSDNPYSLHWNLVFGFPPHMGFTYKIANPNNTSLPETDYKRLLDFVKDGSPMKMHGREVKPVPIDHIYAYYLSGMQLTNQTDLTRKRILQDLSNQK